MVVYCALPSQACANRATSSGATAYAAASRSSRSQMPLQGLRHIQSSAASSNCTSGPFATSQLGKRRAALVHASSAGKSSSAELGRWDAQAKSLEAMQAWLAARGVQSEKVALARRIEDDRPVLTAAKDVASGEALFSVPEDLWLTPAVSKISCKNRLARAAQRALRNPDGLEPWLQLALLLLRERFASGVPSPFSTYVRSLPDVLDSPLFWSDEQLGMLAGTQLLQSVEGYRSFFEAKYAELQSLLPSLGLRGEAASYEAFLWAAATVRGRLHSPLEGQQAALVPGADAVIHRRSGNVVWRVKSTGMFGRTRALSVEAARAVRRGEELCMDYGAAGKLDSVVLLDHGVVDAKGLQPGYLLTLELPQSDRYIDDKQDILEVAGVPLTAGPLASAYELRPGTAPSVDMLAFLRLQQLSGTDAFLLESIFRQEAWAFMCDPVSETNEEAVCRSMAAGARDALAGYPTTVAEDLALLRSGAVRSGSREELALQIRLGEKEALDATLSFFEARQKDLKRLTYYQERRLRRLGLMDEDGHTTYDSFFSDGIA